MFRLAPKGDGRPFASRELHEVSEGVRAELQREVDNKYRINPVALQRNEWTADESEPAHDAARDLKPEIERALQAIVEHVIGHQVFRKFAILRRARSQNASDVTKSAIRMSFSGLDSTTRR